MSKNPYLLCFAITILLSAFGGAAAAKIAPPDSIKGVTVYGERPEFVQFEYGLNIGFYSANRSTANYYNGSGENSLEQAITRTHNYDAIRREIGYDFHLRSLPQSMTYRPSILMGFFGVLNMSARLGILAEFNYSKLRTEDQFTLYIDNPSNLENDNIEPYAIWGIEERLDLRFGFKYTFVSETSYIHPFVETGVSITDTKVKENRARILSTTISVRNPQNVYYQQRDYGIGFGGFGSLGLKMDVNDYFALTIGYSGNYSRINLGENDSFALQHTAFIRLNLNNLIGVNQPSHN